MATLMLIIRIDHQAIMITSLQTIGYRNESVVGLEGEALREDDTLKEPYRIEFKKE